MYLYYYVGTNKDLYIIGTYKINEFSHPHSQSIAR